SLVIWRTEVVRAVPQTASLFGTIGLPVNLRGLVFENVRTTGELHEGVPVLIIEGSVSNVAGKSVEVPRLRFAMRNRAGHEVYACGGRASGVGGANAAGRGVLGGQRGAGRRCRAPGGGRAFPPPPAPPAGGWPRRVRPFLPPPRFPRRHALSIIPKPGNRFRN